MLAVKQLYNGVMDDDVPSYLFELYIIPTWLWVMYLNYRIGKDLFEYLKEKHYEVWNEITYVPFLGINGNNSFRSLPFIYSRNDLDDYMVDLLKKRYRRFIIFAIVVLISTPPLSIVVN